MAGGVVQHHIGYGVYFNFNRTSRRLPWIHLDPFGVKVLVRSVGGVFCVAAALPAHASVCSTQWGGQAGLGRAQGSPLNPCGFILAAQTMLRFIKRQSWLHLSMTMVLFVFVITQNMFGTFWNYTGLLFLRNSDVFDSLKMQVVFGSQRRTWSKKWNYN
jgi:hypothetical protein